MGRAFEYRKAAKLKRWGHMAKTFTRLIINQWEERLNIEKLPN